jgi:hypothetical protein
MVGEVDKDATNRNEISTHNDDLENNIGTQSGMVEVERYITLCIDKIGMSLYLWPLVHRWRTTSSR